MRYMCTINGIINTQLTKKQARKIVKKMHETASYNLAQRGKIFSKANTHLAARPQTYAVNGNRYTIVYNGQLLNVSQLCNFLNKKQISFRSHDEAEIVVKLFAVFGATAFRKLNGNFAFVLYEHQTQKTYLVRDPLGIKSLFYIIHDNTLIFSSQIKGLLAHPDVAPCVDMNGLRELFGVCPARTPGKTVYKNILEIKPGAYGLWQNNKLVTRTYFKLVSRPHRDSSTATMQKLKDILTDTIQQQLATKQKVGLMLSGGLDSSTLTALATHNNKHYPTFSVDYVGNQENFQPTDFSPTRDNYYIDLVARQYKLVHNYKVLNSADLCHSLHDALLARDYPSMADIDSSLLLFCRSLKKDIDVCFSGEFADEIFCGYPWFYRADTDKATTFPWAIDLSVRENTIAKHLRKRLNIKDFVTKSYALAVAEVPLSSTDSAADRKMKIYSYLTMRWFGLNLLERGDRMADMTKLDIRLPFTNLDLVQYVYNIPWEMKNFGNQEKGILRAAVADLLPPEVIARKKCPYPKTIDPTYTTLVETRIRTILADKAHPIWQIVDKPYIQDVLDNPTNSQARPWFGQLMQRPQYLAFIYQIAMWLVEYKIQLDLPKV